MEKDNLNKILSIDSQNLRTELVLLSPKERKEFEKTIGGGKWSMNDSLVERQKI